MAHHRRRGRQERLVVRHAGGVPENGCYIIKPAAAKWAVVSFRKQNDGSLMFWKIEAWCHTPSAAMGFRKRQVKASHVLILKSGFWSRKREIDWRLPNDL